ncbi:MAG TPA: lysophospholipid acyltransferase family protein [Solirubrobacteraceae bacterium]|nr:lysophospholipid acyltransferase family protein [Solirubrobacteraceae bacterium]
MDERKLAPLKPQVYLDGRPAAYFDRFHARARSHDPDWVYTFVRVVSYPYCRIAFRLHARNPENVPSSGPVILAPNHFSAMDHWFVGILLRRRVRFMAKSQLFKGPLLEFVLPHAGAFPVRRGHRDEEAITTALAILERGGMLVIYPEGGRSRSGQIGTSARSGIGRLALESGAPVVPVAVNGSERARNWRRLQFPAVTISYGEPLRFGPEPGAPRERQQAVADEVLATIRALHAELG